MVLDEPNKYDPARAGLPDALLQQPALNGGKFVKFVIEHRQKAPLVIVSCRKDPS